MTTFRVADLPTETRTTHESQNKWRRKNWEKTLKEHKENIEELLKKISLFDVWSNKLQDNDVAVRLIPEIFMDAYISIHLAGYGLYKYACMSLRSELETALRLVFFSTHPVEFKWWSDGNEGYRSGLKIKEVWGESYNYFEQLDNIKEFEKLCDDNKKLFGGIRGVYKTLSKFIHSGAGHFQTRPDRVSPKYKLEEFKSWIKTFKEVQEYINILFALSFYEEFKKLNVTDQKKIKEMGIESSYYRENLEKVLGS